MAKVTLSYDERFKDQVAAFVLSMQSDPEATLKSLAPMRAKYEKLNGEATNLRQLHDSLAGIATMFGHPVEKIEKRGAPKKSEAPAES